MIVSAGMTTQNPLGHWFSLGTKGTIRGIQCQWNYLLYLIIFVFFSCGTFLYWCCYKVKSFKLTLQFSLCFLLCNKYLWFTSWHSLSCPSSSSWHPKRDGFAVVKPTSLALVGNQPLQVCLKGSSFSWCYNSTSTQIEEAVLALAYSTMKSCFMSFHFNGVKSLPYAEAAW